MLSNHDDLLDHTSHQGFEINDTTRQRVIGYVKAEIASQPTSTITHLMKKSTLS